MPTEITGIHHVTALAKHPKANLDFYTRVLGLRFIKKTVNFDDPFTYHLYYADSLGRPGTVLTHFPHPMASRARHGSSEITDTALAVPRGAMGFWSERLALANIASERDTFTGRDALRFEDPDGMRFALLEDDSPTGAPGHESHGVDAAHAITGVERAVIRVPDARQTIAFLESALGFGVARTDGNSHLLHIGEGRPGQRLEVVHDPTTPHFPMGAGTVHHVAWRVPDDDAQLRVQDAIMRARVGVTEIKNRLYFRSIYFRVPGGVIFEVATDGPGFDVDEPMDALGTSLRVPPMHEHLRTEIERHLIPLDTTDT
ncbi:MAG: VOC family protein [Phycisphaeraceae bacterium]|nr:VOC family protein [Phycisphaeraceae bacterium]